MCLVSLLQLGGLALISVSVAITALWILAHLSQKFRIKPPTFSTGGEDSVAFLFDDERLVNATRSANQILSSAPAGTSDWAGLLLLLQPRFPNLEEEISLLADRGHLSLPSLDGASRLEATWKNGLARIVLIDEGSPIPKVKLDKPSFDALKKELETLRATAEFAPFLVWRQRQDGTITWANNAYLNLSQSADSKTQTPVWPPAGLFNLKSTRPKTDTSSQRVSVHIPGEANERWFECSETPIGNESLFTAVAADKVVKAEGALRDFVQTLTKTFAHLTIGLAIFDKQRRLALFNPALTDLIPLPVEFLSSKPTLQSVLDQMREKQMIPEPKDYKSWRQQLFELEAAAANGTYEETWSLSNGRTYRVSGRPHPDGAVAFLFEDISAEISLTRQFRNELDVGQAVLDTLNEAIAVFSAGGILTLSNSAYCALWAFDPTTILGDIGILDATRTWGGKCAPSPVWGDAREYIGTIGERAEWSGDVQMKDGRSLFCEFVPISGGATMVRFRVTNTPAFIPSSIDESCQILSAETISA